MQYLVNIDITDRIMIVSIVAMILDYLSGVSTAIIHKELRSQKMKHGLAIKASYLAIILISYFIDRLNIADELDLPVSLTPLIAGSVIIMECVSIIENIRSIDPSAFDNTVFDVFKNAEAKHKKEE